jgi:hypothetical protein
MQQAHTHTITALFTYNLTCRFPTHTASSTPSAYPRSCIPEKDGTFNFGSRAKFTVPEAAALRAHTATCTPTDTVNGAACAVLYEMRINTATSCASVGGYKTEFLGWVEGNFSTMSYVAISIGVVQVFAMLVACGMICTTDHTPKVYEEDSEML